MLPKHISLCRLGTLGLLLPCAPVLAQTDIGKPNLATPVRADAPDPDAFRQWVDGQETAVPGPRGLDQVLFAQAPKVGTMGVTFGDSKNPGPRYLRIGFTQPVLVGSVLVRGGGTLSVLKPEAAYPGVLDDDSQWLPAQRLVDGELSTDEVDGEEYAVWTLPPGTKTRALRFCHTADATDRTYGGSLNGVFVLGDRVTDLGPLAVASSSKNNQKASKLIGRGDVQDSGWDNAPKEDSPEIRDQSPWVMLSWPAPVRLSGLTTLGTGFRTCEVQMYAGPADKHPREASEGDWKSIGSYDDLKSGFGGQMMPNRLDFPQPVTTRGIRLRLTSTTQITHPFLTKRVMDGRRVWLGKLMALEPLDNAPLQAVNFPAPADGPHPPIPVRFNLKAPGFVTLVVEDSTGKRVRNLVSETYFAAGNNVVWWDGTDDLGRDQDAIMHGVYKIPEQTVAPGNYTVRGLVHDAIQPRYEFSVYNQGSPPWRTADSTGGWLANHTPPQSALFVPADKSPKQQPVVLLGSYVTEGACGLATVNLDGKKLDGKVWIGGTWTAAPFLARDAGPRAAPDIYAYVGAVWPADKADANLELRLTGLAADKDLPLPKYSFPAKVPGKYAGEMGGLAVWSSIAVVSLPLQNQLVFVDIKQGKVLGTAPVEGAKGLAFDAQGRLLAVCGTKVVRFENAVDPARLGTPVTVAEGLESGDQIALDQQGNLYVSDRGQSHQVKVFDTKGKLLRSIGKPGAPKAGPYDPLHMNNPAGLAVDSNGHLWVTENDFLPKRVSVWTLDGQFVKAFYGPSKYGGGGSLDSTDNSRFYYADEGRGTMEFRLDWQTGEAHLANVLYRNSDASFKLANRAAAPETALYLNGKRYFTNCYNSSPTGGASTAFIFAERDGILRPIAAAGNAGQWELLKSDAFLPRLPEEFGGDWKRKSAEAIFVWSDSNGDGQVEPEEVSMQSTKNVSGVTVMPDLSFCIARSGGDSLRLAPTGISAQGIPSYSLSKAEKLASGVMGPGSSGGDQVLTTGGLVDITLGMAPFAQLSFSGGKAGAAQWSYPSLWPGLHASHRAPQAKFPGEMIGTTRLLGGYVTPGGGSDAGPLWAVNGNKGQVFLFTADGLYVGGVFRDLRRGKTWTMPSATRNMPLDDVTLGEENFWPSISQSPEGKIYLVDGARMAIVRLDGLDSLRRLRATPLKVSPEDLQQAQAYRVAAEAQRQQEQGRGVLRAAITAKALLIDGSLEDWEAAEFVDIDRSGITGGFNTTVKAYDVTAAMRISGDKLYAAWTTGDPKLLRNSGEAATAPFKTGGALDIMLATDPNADPKRTAPAIGDLRLLITQAKGKTFAVLYRPKVAGAKDPVPFASPWRTITIDKVENVSSQVQLAGKDGNYEISVPLATLGFTPKAGTTYRGDIGILRGDGSQTTARIYWSNKATGIVSDVPDEATLSPQLWGPLEVETAP